MPAPPALTVKTAELPGDPNKPSEDRIFQTDNAVIVLDGATQPIPLARSGGWYADTLGRRLVAGLEAEPTCDLVELLEHSIADLVERYELEPQSAPSSTVAMVRWSPATFDALVLCDSPIAVELHSGVVVHVRDDRLDQIEIRLPRPSSGPRDMQDSHWIERTREIESFRNCTDGFWVASATPNAAAEAAQESFNRSSVRSILIASDGTAAGVDRYQLFSSWSQLIESVRTDPKQTLQAIDHVELTDPDCARWRRSKQHDDKAVALIEQAHHRSISKLSSTVESKDVY